MRMKLYIGLAALLVLTSCLHEPEAIPEPLIDISLFYEVWDSYETGYPLFAHKEIDWTEIGDKYYPLALKVETREDLYMLIADMLGELEDPALYVKTPEDEYIYPYIREYQSNVDEDVLIQNYLESYGWLGYSGFMGVGYCDPTLLPYICFTRFPTNSEWDIWVMGRVDTFLSECIENDVEAIILDVRLNPQNYKHSSEEIMGRFLTHSHVGAVYRSRIGLLYDMYYDSHPAFDLTGPRQFTGTVYILAGEACTLVAEDLVANMEYFPNVVVLGDTTSGNCTTGYSKLEYTDFELGLFWDVKIGTTTLLTHDYSWIHGVGVPPDVYIEATAADFAAGVDPVLEYAIDLVNGTE